MGKITKCTRFEIVKPVEDFYKDRSKRTGHTPRCRACLNAYMKSPRGREVNKRAVIRYSRTDRGKARANRSAESYSRRHPDKVRAKNRSYYQRVLKDDPIFKLKRAVRSLVGRAAIRRTESSIALIGCSIDALREHLERQFYDRGTGMAMSWSNYGRGGWHIDHIKPICSFDLSDPAQLKECCHHSNLRPLWCEDNCAKAAKDKLLS